LVIIIILITLGSGDGRQGVGSFDEPAECEEGNASKNGSAPCLRRPPAILPDGEPSTALSKLQDQDYVGREDFFSTEKISQLY
jgi:hypothetical protein